MGHYRTTAAAVAAASGGPTTVDLSAGTAADPNSVLDAGLSSLGTSSTIVADTNHGLIDGHLDCYRNLTQVSARPSTSRCLHVRMSVGTLPTEDPGTAGCTLDLVVSRTNGLVTNHGYRGGLNQDPSSVLKSRSVARIGSIGSNVETLAGAPAVAELFVQVDFDGTSAVRATFGAFGQTSGSDDDTETVATGGTWDDQPWVGVALSQIGGSPASVVTWGAVVITYQWI